MSRNAIEQLLFTSREKAVSCGLYAVRQGQASTGGTFAAAVSDSTRTVMWACHVDLLTYDAEALWPRLGERRWLAPLDGSHMSSL